MRGDMCSPCQQRQASAEHGGDSPGTSGGAPDSGITYPCRVPQADSGTYTSRSSRADLRRSHPIFDGLNITTKAADHAAVNAAPAHHSL